MTAGGEGAHCERVCVRSGMVGTAYIEITCLCLGLNLDLCLARDAAA